MSALDPVLSGVASDILDALDGPVMSLIVVLAPTTTLALDDDEHELSASVGIASHLHPSLTGVLLSRLLRHVADDIERQIKRGTN